MEFHSVIALNKTQTLCWVCPELESNDVTMYAFREGSWHRQKEYPKNLYPLIQLTCSLDESFIIGSFMTGFQLWNVDIINKSSNVDGCTTTLKLPIGIRNIATKMNKSNSCVLSAKNAYAIAGIRKELYIWSVETGGTLLLINRLQFSIHRSFDNIESCS